MGSSYPVGLWQYRPKWVNMAPSMILAGIDIMYLQEEKISCPYCGELIDVLIDCSEDWQTYIEDCQVCCRPIVFRVTVTPSGAIVDPQREDDC